MPTGQARTADEITDNLRTLIDRVVEARVTQEVAHRGQEVADVVGTKANEAWRESRPMRRDVAKQLRHTAHDAAKWSDRTWRKSVRPVLKDWLKEGRKFRLGLAGAAVPAARELVDTAEVRLGMKQREERHWGAFFLGLLIGAAVGAIAAMLTTPKRGVEMRQELGARAEELANRAKDEWVPIFERAEGTNGHQLDQSLTGGDVSAATAAVQEGAADAASTAGDAAEEAASETAEAINDAYGAVEGTDVGEAADTIERESTS
jgi:gas vesicle protein